MTDKFRSYSSALRVMAPFLIHIIKQYANNRAKVSHERTRHQERQMPSFKLAGQAQRFLFFHGLVNHLCRQPRNILSVVHYRILRDKAFTTWKQPVRVD
jgi:transposase-like protein